MNKFEKIKRWKEREVEIGKELQSMVKDSYSFDDVLERSALHEERLECQRLIEAEIVK